MSDNDKSLQSSSKFSSEENLEQIKEKGKQEQDKRKDNIGIVGLLLGSSKNAPTNISGVLIFILIVFGILFTLLNSKNIENIEKIWAIIAPMITLSLGYMFGRKL